MLLTAFQNSVKHLLAAVKYCTKLSPSTSIYPIPTAKIEETRQLNYNNQRNLLVGYQIACENIRFSSLFDAGDISRGGTSATQRQRNSIAVYI